MENVVKLFLILLFSAEVILIIITERKKYRTIVTPGIVFSVPLYSVVMLAYLFGSALGYIAISNITLAICIIFIFLFVVAGNILGIRYKSDKKYKNQKPLKNSYESRESQIRLSNKLCFYSVGLLIFMFLYILVFKRDAFQYIAKREFGEIFNQGINGHIFVLLNFFAIIMLATFDFRKSKKALFISLIIILYSVVAGAKYTFITVIISGATGRILLGVMKLKFRNILFLGFIMITGAAMTYLIRFSLDGTVITFDIVYSVLMHLSKYLFSGVLSMGQAFEVAKPTYNLFTLFIPVLSIINFLTFNMLQLSVPKQEVGNWFDIGATQELPVNVNSFFGDIYFRTGYIGLVILTIFFAVLAYWLFIKYLKGHNIWILMAYVVLAAPFALSWFAYYFNLLVFYEMIFYCFIMYLVFGATKRTASINKMRTTYIQ